MLTIFIMVLNLMVDIGLMKVINCVIKTVTKPYKIGKAMVVCIFVGEAVATGAISSATSKYIDNTMDEAARFICKHGWDKAGIWKKWLEDSDKKEVENGRGKQLDECGSVQAKFKQS